MGRAPETILSIKGFDLTGASNAPSTQCSQCAAQLKPHSKLGE
jgi:hypothetical protein